MPELPVYRQQNNVAPQVNAPERHDAASYFEPVNNIMNTMQGIEDRWRQANDVMQLTEASTKFRNGVSDLEQRAYADPEFRNSDKYIKELESIKNNSISGIANKQNASKASLEFDSDAYISSIKIRSNFQKKQIDYNKGMLKDGVDTLMREKVSAATDIEANQYQSKIQELVDANLSVGTIDRADADKIISDAQKTSVQYQIYNDPAISENDSSVLKELQNPKGKYSFLSPDERLDLIKESQRRIFQNNQSYRKEVDSSQNERNIAFIEKIASGDATFQDIDKEMKVPEELGGMKRSTLLKFKKGIESRVEHDLDKMLKEKTSDNRPAARAKKVKEYNDLIDMFIDDKSDQLKAKEMVVDAWADGTLNAKEQSVLYKLKDNLKDIKFNRDTGIIVGAIKSIKSMMKSSNSSDEDIAIRVKQLLGEISDGKPPQEIHKQILSDEMIKHFPDYKSYPPKGRKKLDKSSGSVFIVYPSGEWEWVGGNNER